MIRTLTFGVVVCLFLTTLNAQPIDTSSQTSFIVLPIVYYTPETSWAFGGASAYVFSLPGNRIPNSQIQLGAAYTLEKQLLTYLSYRIYYKEWNTFGELGYYRYTYRFFGIGDQPTDDYELYDVNFPRIRMSALRRVRQNQYIGLTLWWEDYQITDLDATGKLQNENILGASGGATIGVGPSFVHDARNSVFFPTTGWYTEGNLLTFPEKLGSAYSFSSLDLNARLFHAWSSSHTLALDAFATSKWGDVPFNMLAFIGGSRRMRGYFEGQYRDRHAVQLQAEHRWLFSPRWGVVGFLALGSALPDFKQVQENELLTTAGVGLRFAIDKARKLNLRLDAGFGKQTSGYYLTVGEAF